MTLKEIQVNFYNKIKIIIKQDLIIITIPITIKLWLIKIPIQIINFLN
jgi:hypothetical protein